MALSDELEAWMRARLEQLPDWPDAMDAPGEFLTLEQTLKIHAGIQGIHREAILRLAEEIDRLRPE